jgi:hypothetical protein
MFVTSEKVICVDDTNPNPLCSFPCGYVVRGRVYHVRGISHTGGVQIVGRPVIGVCWLCALAGMFGEWPHECVAEDVGWKRHRFRKCDEVNSEEVTEFSTDAAYVEVGSIQ